MALALAPQGYRMISLGISDSTARAATIPNASWPTTDLFPSMGIPSF